MCPCMCGNLMTFAVHASDKIRPPCVVLVDLSFPKIVAGDEEGSFGIVASKNIEEIACVVERTVIERQRDLAPVEAIVDAFPFIGDITNEWSRYVESGFAEGLCA